MCAKALVKLFAYMISIIISCAGSFFSHNDESKKFVLMKKNATF